MAVESPTSSLHLLKENRVNLEPDVPSSIIEFQVPSSAIIFSRASRPKRQILRALPTYKTEDELSSGTIASASSIHFCRPDRYPRVLLWRLLEDNRVLEIRSVDLSKSSAEENDANNILRFYFPATIRHGGIALADVEGQSALNVFALTTSNELYTLNLKSSFFCDASASEEDIGRWCKAFKPASTNFSTPHQFVAVSSLELLIGLSDGRLLHLTRASGSDSTSWHELACNDGQWGSSLRSLVRWQGSNTVRYGNATLDQGTVQSMAYSPDKKHLWMVCLNHTLKVRNMEQSKTIYTVDLLGINREPHEISKLLLDPGNTNLLQVFAVQGSLEGDQYYLMTFSPHDLGQFKIWAIRDADAGGKGIRDLYPDNTFLPPDPDPDPDSKAIWKVADFKVMDVVEGGGSFLHVWILMRSNRRCKLYNLKLPSADLRNSLSYAWNNDWTVAASEVANHDTQPQITGTGPEGVFENWLDFILQPGKYPTTVIETALSIHATTRKSNLLLQSGASLRERIYSVVSSHVTLQRRGSDIMDFEAYQETIEEEFGCLWQELRDLDSRSWDSASLAYDSQNQMPWLVFASGCSPIRQCNQTELILHNTEDILRSIRNEPTMQLALPYAEDQDEPVLPDELAVIVAAAANFRRTFGRELLQAYNSTLVSELWQEPSHAASLRIQMFYENCAFDSEIENKAFDRLASQLDSLGGFSGLKNTHFKAITNNILNAMPASPSTLKSTYFGLKVAIRGVQELVMLSHQILYDLLILVIIVEMEGDGDEMSTEDFDSAELFVGILDVLKQIQVVRWLAMNAGLESTKPPNYSDTEIPSVIPQDRNSTVLEQSFAPDVVPRDCTDRSERLALTEIIQDIIAWTMGGNYDVKLEDILVRIQCNLLAHKSIDLACDFLRYQPNTSWATYVKGRLCLLTGDFAESAMHFQKASFGLSRPGHYTDPATSDHFLSPIEADHLGQGLPAYFTHIQDLFQIVACPGYVATFARKNLQQTQPNRQNAPLTTLFHASVSTCDFDSAFSVLTRLPTDQSSALLPSFLTALLAEDEFNRALDLPWPPKLLPHIEDFLAQKATKTPTATFYNPSAPQYNKLLAAWRMRYLDYRGAAAALLAHLQRVQKSSRSSYTRSENDGIISTYLSVINLLACCGGEDEAWVLTDAFDDFRPKGKGGQRKDESQIKRILITIKDVRAGYQKELDRRSMLENGRWGFGLEGAVADEEGQEDEMDVDVRELEI